MSRWDRIGLYLPTYGRARTKLPRHIASACEMVADRKAIYYVFVINEHDTDTTDSVRYLMGKYGVAYEIVHERESRPHLARYFNLAYYHSNYHPDSMVASMVGDDMTFETPGWEQRILEEVNRCDGVGLFYCAGDERFGDALCVNAFLTRKFVTMCGCKFMCDHFPANGIDMVWQLAADATDLDYYIEDVIIRHWQCSREDVGWDDTYHRLHPCRIKAIREKSMEKVFAQKIVTKLNTQGYGDPMRKAVAHLQHNREGRHRLRKKLQA